MARDNDDDRAKRKKPSEEIADAPKRSRPRADDADDDDADRPAPRKPKREAGGSSMGLIIGGILGAVFLVLCCGGAGLLGWFALQVPVAHVKEAAPLAHDGEPVVVPKANENNPPKPPPKPVKPAPKKPVKAVNVVADAQVSLPTQADSQVRDLALAAEAPRAAVFFWSQKEDLAKTVDVWDWQARKRVNRIVIPDEGSSIQLSPGGTRLLVQKSFPPRLDMWNVADGNKIMNEWNPYPKGAPKALGLPPELVWAYFVTDERVLTVDRNGQFDLWNTTQNQRIYSVPAPQKNLFLQHNGFARAPQNFALSPNRKTLALTNGDGFDLFDAATGNRLGKTASFAAEGKVGNTWSVAFNQTGTMLACRSNLNLLGNKRSEFITVWDVPSGKRKWHHPVLTDFSTNGPITFVGADHLMVFDGNVFKGTVLSLKDGRYQRVCKTSGQVSRIATTTPDGRIWYVARTAANTPGVLAAAELPAADLERNPAPAVNNLRQLPMWGLYPDSIRSLRPNEI